jgi:predicted dehydrogenase
MKTWRIGIVGAGLIAEFHAKAIGDIENACVAGFCSRGGKSAESLCAKFGGKVFSDYEVMAQDEDVDILILATPSGFHAEPAIAAAKNSKHVLCEKPLEITLERLDSMIDAHEKSGTKLGCIFQNRFADSMAPLRGAIEQGRFGTVTYAGVYVPWWRSEEYYSDSWHGTQKLDGGGALMNQSIHMIDMMCDLMGQIRSVAAFTSDRGHSDIEVEDSATAAVKFEDGVIGVIYGSTASWPGHPKRFEIMGTKGSAVWVDEKLVTWQFADARPEDDEIRAKFGGQTGEGKGSSDPAAISYELHKRSIESFISWIEGRGEYPVDARAARESVAVILAIYESAKTGRAVDVL